MKVCYKSSLFIHKRATFTPQIRFSFFQVERIVNCVNFIYQASTNFSDKPSQKVLCIFNNFKRSFSTPSQIAQKMHKSIDSRTKSA